MRWKEKTPREGFAVRVKAEFYYHYGIYQDDDHVYAFGYANNEGIPKEEIAIVCTTMDEFRQGGMVECGVMDLRETMNCKSARNALVYAKDHLGETGYDITNNNCEHFVERCLYGEKLAQSGRFHLA